MLVGNHDHTWPRPYTGQRTKGHELALNTGQKLGQGNRTDLEERVPARVELQARSRSRYGGEARAGGGCQQRKGGQRVRKRRGREVSLARVHPPQRQGREQHTAFQCFLVKMFFGGRGRFCFLLFKKKNA